MRKQFLGWTGISTPAAALLGTIIVSPLVALADMRAVCFGSVSDHPNPQALPMAWARTRTLTNKKPDEIHDEGRPTTMHKLTGKIACVVAVFTAAVAIGSPAAAQEPEPMYNITQWGDYTAMTAVLDLGSYGLPSEFYFQFTCGAGFVGVSTSLDGPRNGELMYMTDPTYSQVRWAGYGTATGPSGNTYLVASAVATWNGCNWTGQGTVLTQWYLGTDFVRQPDITNRAIDETWFMQATATAPTDPKEFWGANLDNTGWGLTPEAPPVIVEGGADSGFGPIDLKVVVPTATPKPTPPATPKPTPPATPKPTPPATPKPVVPPPPGGAGGAGGGAGAGAAGGGGGSSIIGLIILILAAFLLAGGAGAWMKKKRIGLWSMTREMGKLVMDLPPDEKRKLVQEFSDTSDKQQYIEYLKGMRDYNLGTREQPPTAPKVPGKSTD